MPEQTSQSSQSSSQLSPSQPSESQPVSPVQPASTAQPAPSPQPTSPQPASSQPVPPPQPASPQPTPSQPASPQQTPPPPKPIPHISLESTQSDTEEEPEQESSSKVLYIVMGVLFVLILIVGGYVVYDRFIAEEETTTPGASESETESDTDEETETAEDNGSDNSYEGWQTYTNDLYDVSFQYPQGWTVLEETGEAPFGTDSRYMIVSNQEEEDVMVLGLGVFYAPSFMGVNITAPNIGTMEVDGATLYKYDCNTLFEVHDGMEQVNDPRRLTGCRMLYTDDISTQPIDGNYLTSLYNTENDPTFFIWYGNMDDMWYIQVPEERTSSSVLSEEEMDEVEQMVESITGLF